MSWTQLFTSSEIESAVSTNTTQALTKQIGSRAGCSILIENESQYGIVVNNAALQVDYLKPGEKVTMPLDTNLSVKLDPNLKGANAPAVQYIGYKLITGVKDYSKVSTQPSGTVQTEVVNNVNVSVQNASIPVTGDLNATIQNASIDTQVLNAKLQTNPLVQWDTLTFNMNYTSQGVGVPIDIPGLWGSYDELFFLIESTTNPMSYYSFQFYYTYIKDSSGNLIQTGAPNVPLSPDVGGGQYDQYSFSHYYGFSFGSSATLMSQIRLYVNASTAPVTETFKITVYAKAISSVVNLQQDTSTKIDTIFSNSQQVLSASNRTVTIRPNIPQSTWMMYKYISALLAIRSDTDTTNTKSYSLALQLQNEEAGTGAGIKTIASTTAIDTTWSATTLSISKQEIEWGGTFQVNVGNNNPGGSITFGVAIYGHRA